MAARSALKLLSKTCPLKPAYCPRIRSLSATDHGLKTIRSKSCEKHGKRSYSQPSKNKLPQVLKGKEHFLQSRSISRSCENLRANRYYEEELDERPNPTTNFRYYTRFEEEEPPQAQRSAPLEEQEDTFIEADVRYELASSPRDEDRRDYFNVVDYLEDKGETITSKLTAHLQPVNMRPFGATDNSFFPSMRRKQKPAIVYPRSAAGIQREDDISTTTPSRRVDSIHHKQYSSYNKEYPGFEEPRKMAICEKSSKTRCEVSKKNYSTTCDTVGSKSRSKYNFGPTFASAKSVEKLPLKVAKVQPMKKAPAPVKAPQKKSKIADLLFPNTIASACLTPAKSGPQAGLVFKLHPEVVAKSRRNLAAKKSEKKLNLSRGSSKVAFLTKSNHALDKPKPRPSTLASMASRKYNTQADQVCNEYVTVKLGELQEQCRQRGECRPKKVKCNRLPKFIAMDCPCGDDPPMKDCKPLAPLKKRFTYADPVYKCDEEKLCTTPRADDNYKIVPKLLPKIEMADCPCVESEMTDFVIKRLPKIKIPEPPKICEECVGEECCPDRSDAGMTVVRKMLPKLIPPDCSCLDAPEMTTVKLIRLKPKPVEEPIRICPELEPCDITLRADHGLTVEPKTLPVLELNDCPCAEMLMPTGAPILKRLKKVVIPEPSKELCEELAPCADAERADDGMEVPAKKLPKFVPADCPCTEPEPMVDVRLKRLPKTKIADPIRVCPEIEICTEPRADDGMEVAAKKLPEIVPGDCPCVEVELLDAPPLKRLIPKPVQEPEKICEECVGEECCPDRSDVGLQVKMKKLPKLGPGDCPCYQPPEMTDPGPLKKLKPKPVKEPEKICRTEYECIIPRADENLKVVPKQLPKLELNNCPCTDLADQKPGKPLPRLKKVHIPEPDKAVCIKVDPCEDIPRADTDDWLYWKQAEVCKKEEVVETCEPGGKPTNPNVTSKRNYSTCSGRTFDYDFARPLLYSLADLFPGNNPNHEPCSYMIDVSAPVLSLNHEEYTRTVSVEKKPIDYVGFLYYNSKQMENTGIAAKAAVINTVSRFISTYKVFCKKNEPYLQPKNPIIQQIEKFYEPFPTPDVIEATKRRSRKYENKRNIKEKKLEDEKGAGGKDNKDMCSATLDEDEEFDECCDENVVVKSAACKSIKQECKQSLWQRIVNFFRARPNCPTAEDIRKLELRRAAEMAAAKAGLCVYDPACCKSEALPKVITADSCCDDDEDEKK